MQRDPDLYRQLLLALGDAHPISQGLCVVHVQERETGAVEYQAHLLKDAGLIELRQAMGISLTARLTDKGHDFLEKIADDTVWSSMKAKAGDKLAGLPFDAIGTLAVEVAKRFFAL